MNASDAVTLYQKVKAKNDNWPKSESGVVRPLAPIDILVYTWKQENMLMH